MSNEQNLEQKQGSESSPEGVRLARFLAHAGVASRRHAEELIHVGRVQVNGQTVTTQGVRIDPERDQIYVDGKRVQPTNRKVYILVNKPAGYISTAYDPQQRPTVLALVPPEIRQLRVYPVGRLDSDTSGLLLLTNDGDFALQLTHPRYSTQKHYEALVQGHPTAEALESLRKGVSINEDDGSVYRTSPADVRVVGQSGAGTSLILTLHEGHKRQVRRMLRAVGYPVRQLTRVGVGELTLQDVAPGKWRYLTDAEVRQLRKESTND
ncbi:pseudouridine synthase [Dictyobacter kobayashii]|uniref:Pseudouridine synthase n=1 Tax=Dictyobacter kobayashii TaxID=2014872 RepID=A0A402AG58_9CHLR|nr:pseudouridine synthase [Dictyobacter kobayashii]GCE18065.1 pseudouridine synthase [Dictyobacter kobayashii]